MSRSRMQMVQIAYSALIFVYSLMLLIFYSKRLFFIEEGVYYFYYVTLGSDFLLIIFIISYFIGSSSFILFKKGVQFLTFGAFGFCIGSIIACLYDEDGLLICLIHFILNGSVFLVFENRIRKRVLTITLFSIALVLVLLGHFIFHTRLFIMQG